MDLPENGIEPLCHSFREDLQLDPFMLLEVYFKAA